MSELSRSRVKPGSKFRLSGHDSSDTGRYRDKRAAQGKLEKDIAAISALQEMMSAQARHALLIIFQGMDAAGKDGAIKHVMTGVNPQGVHVYAFKAPTGEELRHDYLWRCMKVIPERGRTGIFNRSYYEDVLVTRVHPEILRQRGDASAAPSKEFWRRRFGDINAYERYLVRNRVHVVKFFLHISKDEQKRRLLARMEDPSKQWKYSSADVKQRAYWKQYMKAYESVLEETSTAWAPWYVIPSDHKWFTRVAVASVLVYVLKSLGVAYPRLSGELKAELLAQRKALERA